MADPDEKAFLLSVLDSFRFVHLRLKNVPLLSSACGGLHNSRPRTNELEPGPIDASTISKVPMSGVKHSIPFLLSTGSF